MTNFKKILTDAYDAAVELNKKNIIGLLEKKSDAYFLDLGCDDGKLTLELAQKIETKNIYGIEIIEEKAGIANNSGIKTSSSDLNKKLPFEDNYFDAANANQIIEHLYDSDIFISEIHRVLKPKGYAIISTENASSWCNIFASIMGWQIFSLTNISNKKSGIGNPLALHKEKFNPGSWNHIRIYNIRGLKELLEAHGFVVENIKGAGYFPLPAGLGNVDITHCHFMAFKIKKT